MDSITDNATRSRPMLLVALIESDPLRLIGFRALLEGEAGLEMISTSISEMALRASFDVVVIGDHPGHNLANTIFNLKTLHPNLPILVIGPANDDEMLNTLVSGAKGYVFDGAPPSEFARAIRVVSGGSVWASRRILSMFVELAVKKGMLAGENEAITDREKQVLKMLVAGHSNKEIGAPLGIVERTVKAHIAKMMRKVGVHNRIELSIHAVTHSLVSLPAN
jgi:DNA-binding NarL/FixJ family response regulator